MVVGEAALGGRTEICTQIQALMHIEAKLPTKQLTFSYFIIWDLYHSPEEITKKILPGILYA